jgi:hypothetical protein
MLGKFLLFLVIGALLASLASAASLLIPQQIMNGNISLNVSEITSVEFLVKGGSVPQNISFFVNTPGYLVQIGGKREFTQNFTLSSSELRKILVNFRGVAPGQELIRYGFYFADANSSGKFKDAISQDFVVNISGSNSTNITNVSVEVVSSPVGAQIYVDGSYYGYAPVSVTVTNATHKFEAKLAGYYDKTIFLLTSENQSTIYMALAKVPVSSGRSSGGGGGGYVPPVARNATNGTKVNNATSVGPVPVQVQLPPEKTVAPVENAPAVAQPLTQPVVENAAEQPAVVEKVTDGKGRTVIIVLIGLMLLTLFINGWALRVSRQEGNS